MKPAATLLFAFVALAAVQDDPADKATFEKICGSCHASQMVKDLKTAGEWSETVDVMISQGAKGTGEQFDRVLRYLARNFTKVNVNTAPAEEIAPVLGIDVPVAQVLVDYRERNGKFAGLDDLRNVPGLDAAKVETRKDRIAFR